jgi:hypothetical protein
MAVLTQWDDPQRTILRYVFSGRYTWEDLHTAAKSAQRLLDSVYHPVDVILDIQHSSHTPREFIGEFRRLATITHPNTGLHILVSNNPLNALLFQTFAGMYRHLAPRYTLVSTLDAAYGLINETRSKMARV